VGPRDPFETALTRVGRTATRAAESPHVLSNTSRSYLAMQHGRLRRADAVGEPTSVRGGDTALRDAADREILVSVSSVRRRGGLRVYVSHARPHLRAGTRA
jgi:hypothetical protein